MKKKLIALIMTMTMGLAIVACGKSGNSANNENQVEVNTETVLPEDIVEDDVAVSTDKQADTTVKNEIEEISFSIFDDGNAVLEKLGEPASTTDSDNYHTNSYYSSAEVTYSTEGDNAEIVEFRSYSDSWKTSKGITIGSTLDEIKAAYGEPTSETNDGEHCVSYIYDDGYSISFNFNSNNEVTIFMIAVGRG